MATGGFSEADVVSAVTMRVIVEARLLLTPGTEQVLATPGVQHGLCPPSLEVHWRPNQTNAKKVFPNRAKRGTKREENSKRGVLEQRENTFFCHFVWPRVLKFFPSRPKL
jgi:hypothetical protein